MLKNLKTARLKRKLTVKQLAIKVQVADSTIYSLENGFRCARVELLIRLADVLKVSTDYLLGR